MQQIPAHYDPVTKVATLMPEEKVRAMRDQVFEKPSTDKNWDGCRENWLHPEAIAWLVQQTGGVKP